MFLTRDHLGRTEIHSNDLLTQKIDNIDDLLAQIYEEADQAYQDHRISYQAFGQFLEQEINFTYDPSHIPGVRPRNMAEIVDAQQKEFLKIRNLIAAATRKKPIKDLSKSYYAMYGTKLKVA